ncbi:MAG: type II secretion system protein, partial [bacterium]|nr:type II secretion system protein [bacterium]
MTRGKKHQTLGFTLMEILVYIAVLAIIISAVLAFLSWAVKSNTKIKAMREVSDNANRAMELMAYEIREAKSVYTPTATSTQLSLETSHSLP